MIYGEKGKEEGNAWSDDDALDMGTYHYMYIGARASQGLGGSLYRVINSYTHKRYACMHVSLCV